MSEDLPEPDRIEGAPHPRDTLRLFGQGAAESAFLSAFNGGRMHHAWMLTGPRGVGKATLAWRIARFLLATPDDGSGLFGAAPAPATLDVSVDHPVARRIHAGSEPRLFHLRRAWDEKEKRLKTVISVDEVRKLKNFFALSAADGGRRVVIVDSADELNANAANALLKVLEEPPAGAVLLLVCHRPSDLLPTIRSRCRTLQLSTLEAQDIAAAMTAAGSEPLDPAALTALAGGSVGEAIRLSNLDGVTVYGDLVSLFSGIPRFDRPAARALAESAAGRTAEARFDLMLGLFDLFLARLARTGLTGAPQPEAASGESALLARLSPHDRAARAWADLHQSLGARARHGRDVNLDPALLILDMVLKVDETAQRISAR